LFFKTLFDEDTRCSLFAVILISCSSFFAVIYAQLFCFMICQCDSIVQLPLMLLTRTFYAG